MLYICLNKSYFISNKCNHINAIKKHKNYLKMSVYSFQKGFNQITVQEARKLRNDLKEVLKINSRPAWLNRLKGNVEPKVSEAEAIESVFKRYGITEVWGE